MGYEQQQQLKQWLLQEIKTQIGIIDEQIKETRTAWDEVTKAQQTLQIVEQLFIKMSNIAKEAAHFDSTPELIDEFEACKALAQEYCEKAEINGVNLIWDSEGEIKQELDRLMNKPLT